MRLFLLVCASCAGPALTTAAAGDDPSAETAKTVLTQKCVACHSGDHAKGKLDLTTRDKIVAGGESGPAIDAKKLEQSLLWLRVAKDEMPPKRPLSADEKQALKDWIMSGAGWTGEPLDPLAVSSQQRAGKDWWSLQPLCRVRVPNSDPIWHSNLPIDDFIAQKLTANQLATSPEADRRTLIRRVTFDLLGLPPSPEEVDEFVQDHRPDSFERLIDRLLASPHHGERWARHWLDVVRFGESNGFERDLPRPNAWRYRDWVVNAINQDMPYDDFVRWQLAGDILVPDDVEAIKAVGFLVAGPHDTVIPVVDRMRAVMRQDELEDIVGTVSQTFLGLTVNCARCHDHKFDPITTREYYQLASALSGIDHGEREFTASEVVSQLADWRARIEQLEKQLERQATSIRESILAERAAARTKPSVATPTPAPIAAWDFTRDLRDLVGNLHVTTVGATRSDSGLEVGGTAFATTSRLPRDLGEKTLEVQVLLKTLKQAGGAAISIQNLDGDIFDAVVYAEQEPGRWMAGSEEFRRTVSFQGTQEELADREPVVISQVYQSDGTIRAYRNGQPYGFAIRKNLPIRFEAMDTQVLFGLRHGTGPGDNRVLNGTILSAKLFDKALSPEEVAISADRSKTYVSEAEIVGRLTALEQSNRVACQSELKRLLAAHADLKKNGPIPVYTAIATQPGPMKVHQRGSVTSLGEVVAPAGLSAIRGLPSEFELRPDAIESHRRLKLANWITDARNPLFARVMANRIWHYHFGSGLVETPNDLGFHAGQPSHHDLLDWLASEFQAGKADDVSKSSGQYQGPGFSMKRMHRQIVSSVTYRQASTFNQSAATIDASNRLLWRMNPRRLEAEEVRDAMLVVAGQLNPQIGGKGYNDVNSYFFKGTQFYDPIDPVGYVNQRRTLYRMWARGGRSPFLDSFDCPDPSTTSPRRSSTVTPLQALSLLNHTFGLRMADRFASSLKDEVPAQPRQQVQRAYQLLFARDPQPDELQMSLDFVSRSGLSEFCRAMWNSSEFLYVD